MNTTDFQNIVYDHFARHGRVLPWREDPSPYMVLVSELMLQQTQVERVIPKFNDFLQQFPTVELLAKAPLSEILVAWQGLGYNRRAKYLHETAKLIAEKGYFPTTVAELTTLPGIGKNTAGAIIAYAFNQPVIYIETNIRTVYFHHYFHDASDVSDTELLPLLEQTLDYKNPRRWYSALMDYGTYLKSQGFGRVASSKHYIKQSAFSGSKRQIRGQVIGLLAKAQSTRHELEQIINDERLQAILNQLEQEKMIVKNGRYYALPN